MDREDQKNTPFTAEYQRINALSPKDFYQPHNKPIIKDEIIHTLKWSAQKNYFYKIDTTTVKTDSKEFLQLDIRPCRTKEQTLKEQIDLLQDNLNDLSVFSVSRLLDEIDKLDIVKDQY